MGGGGLEVSLFYRRSKFSIYFVHTSPRLGEIFRNKNGFFFFNIAIIGRLLSFYAENVTAEARTSSEPPEASPVHSQSQQQSSQQQPPQQPLQQQQAAAQQYREAQVPRPSQQPSTPEKPAWGYGLDLIGSQASAFWQNYQGQFSQRHATSPSSYPVAFGFAVPSIHSSHGVPTEPCTRKNKQGILKPLIVNGGSR